jgi:hypothetical protein
MDGLITVSPKGDIANYQSIVLVTTVQTYFSNERTCFAYAIYLSIIDEISCHNIRYTWEFTTKDEAEFSRSNFIESLNYLWRQE